MNIAAKTCLIVGVGLILRLNPDYFYMSLLAWLWFISAGLFVRSSVKVDEIKGLFKTLATNPMAFTFAIKKLKGKESLYVFGACLIYVAIFHTFMLFGWPGV